MGHDVDPPTTALGIQTPGTYNPLLETSENRVTRFAHWVSSYFAHGDLSTRDVRILQFKDPNEDKKSISATLSLEKLNSLVDYNAPARSDFLFRAFDTQLFSQTCKVLFDPETRSQWPNLVIWVLYCDSSPGLVVSAAWELEKLAAKNNEPVQILPINDAHHLVRGVKYIKYLY
jgi:hypothetical protein